MKKIIFLFVLVLAVAVISGYKQYTQNEMAEKYAKPAAPKDLKGINKPDVPGSKVYWEFFTPKKAPEGKPGILFMLSNDKGQPGWSHSLWWANTGQSGC